MAEAAAAGDIAAVRRLLKEGSDVNAAMGDGTTALHHAAMRGDAEMVTVLLYAGANVRATTRLGGYTPLHLASQRGHEAAIEALVKGGANPNLPTVTGATSLMLAAASGHIAAVKQLLAHQADVNAKENANGQTALMFAAAYDRPEVVKLLVELGADVALESKVTDISSLVSPEEALQEEIRLATQRTPTNAGGKSAAPTLTAPPPPDKPANDIPGVTRAYRYNELIGKQGGLSAMHYAVRQGSMASVKALLDGRADVNQRVAADGTTPLLMAIINGHYDLAMFLLEQGGDPNAASEAGAAPLYATINIEWAPKSFYPQPRAQLQQRTSYLTLMQALLDKGADPERAAEEEGLVHAVQLRPPAHGRGRRDAVLARRLRQRHRGDEAPDRARRRSANHHHQGAGAEPVRAGGHECGESEPGGADAHRLTRNRPAARRRRRGLRRGLRRQRAPLCRHRHDVGGEVPHRRGGRRRERGGR